jgi:hypothetical protein
MDRLSYDIAARLDAAGWKIADTDEDWIAVWHSNGDDQRHFTRVNGEWSTYTTDRDDHQLDAVTPLITSTDVAAITDAALTRLSAWDPICERCGYQGHATAECDQQ